MALKFTVPIDSSHIFREAPAARELVRQVHRLGSGASSDAGTQVGHALTRADGGKFSGRAVALVSTGRVSIRTTTTTNMTSIQSSETCCLLFTSQEHQDHHTKSIKKGSQSDPGSNE